MKLAIKGLCFLPWRRFFVSTLGGPLFSVMMRFFFKFEASVSQRGSDLTMRWWCFFVCAFFSRMFYDREVVSRWYGVILCC